MKRYPGVMVLLGVAVGFGLLLAPVAPVAADENVSNIVRGGKLYDRWYKVTGAEEPADTHPSYPSEGEKSGAATWRCKECHGWDYSGKDGAYASGSHYTGIVGIRAFADADPAAIVAILKDETHAFSGQMDETDFQDLALFVSKGQLDTDQFIDRGTAAPINGDAASGEVYFNTVCANCHREDGTRPKEMGKSLGSQMGNPWEVMNKIMNGQPGEKMPALRAFGMQPVLDLMAYIATLPKKKL